MKKVYLIFLFITVVTFGYSQRWQHIYGYPGTDEFCNKFAETYDKGYILSSSFEDGSNWLIKSDINGNILWDKLINWQNSTINPGYPIQDSNGNYILAGSVRIENEGHSWPMLNKLNSCGEPVFCRVFKDEDSDWAFFTDAILLENHDILAMAHHEKLNVDRKNTQYLYYITSDGELLWKKAFATYQDHPLISDPVGNKLISFNGEYYIAGGCYYAYPEDPDHFWRRSFFCGIDSLFNEKWILPFGMDDRIPGDAHAILPLNDSVLMGAGIGYFLDDTISTFLYTNSFLMFVNINGEELGYNHISNSEVGSTIQANSIFDIANINDTLFIATVKYGDDPSGSNPSGEFIIDTSCNIYNKQSRAGTLGYSKVVKTFDDKYAISVGYRPADDWDFLFYKINSNLEQDTVYTGTYVYDSLCPDSIESGVIDISDCLVIVDTEETPGPEEYFKNKNRIIVEAVPNPATGNIRLLLTNKDNLSELQLLCSDTFGRQLYSAKLDDNQSEVSINISTWSSGMYVAYITSNGKMVGQCRFVVR